MYFNTYETKDLRKKGNIVGFDVMNYEDKFITQFGTFDFDHVNNIVKAFWVRVKKSAKAYMSFGDIIIKTSFPKDPEKSLLDLTFDEIKNLDFEFKCFKQRLDSQCFFTLGTRYFQIALMMVVADIRNTKDDLKAYVGEKDLLTIPTFISLWALFTISRDLEAKDRYDDYAIFANYLINDQMERIQNRIYAGESIGDAEENGNREVFRLIGILQGIKLFESYRRAYLSSKKENSKPLTKLKVDSMESDLLKIFYNKLSTGEYVAKYGSKGSLVNILKRYAEVDL
jgi:hypothetical protein